MDGEQWLASYRGRLNEIGARAADVRKALAGAEGTASSRDGAVTVTVAPGGALRRLVLSERAERLTRVQLAEAVVATAQQAHDVAAQQAADTVAPLIGDDSGSMRALRGYLRNGDGSS
jgi:hypothetical protein